MRYNDLPMLIITALLAGASQAQAGRYVGVGMGIGDPPAREATDYDSWQHRHHRFHRPVVVSPVVVAPAPYYGGYAYPVYTPAPPQPPMPNLSGDYGTDLANLNGRLSRLSDIVQHQHQKGSFSQAQSDRFMNTLDGIEHDEHVRSFDRGGNLAPEDFADLYRRLDQASEDIEIALAQ